MLESSRDQLGEQMQIHELTRPRKVDEAAGAVSAVLGGIGQQLGKQAMSKAFGGTDVLGKFGGNTSNTDRAGAYKQGMDMARTMVPIMQKSWQQAVQEFLSQSKDKAGNPATNLKMVTTPSLGTLKVQLDQLISQSINPQTSFVYTQIPQYVGDDPTSRASANTVVRDLETISTEIYNATIEGNDTSQAWQKLVTNGIVPAQNVMAYDKGTNMSSKPRFGEDSLGRMIISIGGAPYELFLPDSNAKHKEIADQMLAGKLR